LKRLAACGIGRLVNGNDELLVDYKITVSRVRVLSSSGKSVPGLTEIIVEIGEPGVEDLTDWVDVMSTLHLAEGVPLDGTLHQPGGEFKLAGTSLALLLGAEG